MVSREKNKDNFTEKYCYTMKQVGFPPEQKGLALLTFLLLLTFELGSEVVIQVESMGRWQFSVSFERSAFEENFFSVVQMDNCTCFDFSKLRS